MSNTTITNPTTPTRSKGRPLLAFVLLALRLAVGCGGAGEDSSGSRKDEPNVIDDQLELRPDPRVIGADVRDMPRVRSNHETGEYVV